MWRTEGLPLVDVKTPGAADRLAADDQAP